MTDGTLVLLYHRVTQLDHDPYNFVVRPDRFAQQCDVLRRRCGDNGLAARTQDKIFVDIADVGNTGAASIYIALDKLRRSGRWTPGARTLLVPAEATKWFFGTVELVG